MDTIPVKKRRHRSIHEEAPRRAEGGGLPLPDEWWKHVGVADPSTRAVAYYRHSAQDRQENSIPLQRDQVRSWASAHGIRVIKEFADHGVSGLSTERRNGFNDMMEQWIKNRGDFRFILVLDVSRWGRFQDLDLSAAYAAYCTRHGKEVVYTSLGLLKQNDPAHAVVVSLERYRAAQFSRELGEKSYRGAVRVIEQGFLSGGKAPYALARVLLDESRRPLRVLKPGEQKAISNQRVTLAPGDPKEIEIVRRIFREFGEEGRDENEIREGLNRDGVPSPAGVRWHAFTIRFILQNEFYIGTIVYNKITKRLQSPKRSNPPEKWIRSPGRFPAIVPRELFDRVQAIFQARKRFHSPDYLLEHLKKTENRNGFITEDLLRSSPAPPSLKAYAKHFGGLGGAYQAIFPEVLTCVRRTVRKKLETIARLVEDHTDFIVLDQCLTLVLQPAVPSPCGFENYWAFDLDPRPVVDITLGIPLSPPPEYSILGYLAFPRIAIHEPSIRLFHTGDMRFEVFGDDGLEFIKDLLN